MDQTPLLVGLVLFGVLALSRYFYEEVKMPFIIITTIWSLYAFFKVGVAIFLQIMPSETQAYAVDSVGGPPFYTAIALAIGCGLFFVVACNKGLEKEEQLYYSIGIACCFLPSLVF